jgi:hypothetical protein
MAASPQDQPAGTQITWEVTGQLEIWLGEGTTSISVRGKGQSAAAGDQEVTCTCSRGGVSYEDTCDEKLTSLEPCTVEKVDEDYDPFIDGFVTTHKYLLKDQRPEPMPDCPMNEQFGAWWDDCTNNWPEPTPGSDETDEEDGTFVDAIGAWNKGVLNPDPLYRDPPLKDQEVLHAQQKFFAGSLVSGKGCDVSTQTVQFYTDYGAAD